MTIRELLNLKNDIRKFENWEKTSEGDRVEAIRLRWTIENILTLRKKGDTKMIKLQDISCVYVGKPEFCMCGCAGKYYYTTLHTDWSAGNRGYKIDKNEVNDKKVQKVFDIMALQPFGNIEIIEGHIFTAVIDNRQVTIYLKEDK